MHPSEMTVVQTFVSLSCPKRVVSEDGTHLFWKPLGGTFGRDYAANEFLWQRAFARLGFVTAEVSLVEGGIVTPWLDGLVTACETHCRDDDGQWTGEWCGLLCEMSKPTVMARLDDVTQHSDRHGQNWGYVDDLPCVFDNAMMDWPSGKRTLMGLLGAVAVDDIEAEYRAAMDVLVR